MWSLAAWAWPHLWSWCLIYRRSIVSVRVHSRSLSLSTRGRSDGGLACRSKPRGGSFNKSLMTPERLQKSKSERRQFLSTVPNGRERETREREERVREWAREGKHKRLLSVIGLPFNSPQGRHKPHFPSSHIEAVLNSDPIALISFFFTCNTFRCLNFNKHEGVSTYSHVFAPSTGFKWRSVSWRPPGKGDRINPEVTWDTETSHIEKSQINRLNVITLPQRTSPVRVCLTRVATH